MINLHPIHIATIRSEQGAIAGANTARSAPGATNQVALFAGGTNGSLVEKFRAVNNGAIGTASTGNVLRLWKLTGSTYQLVREIAIVTANPSATVVGSDTGEIILNMRLDATETLTCTLHTYTDSRDGYVVSAEGGDY